jgi:hypothetical protein
MICGNMVRCKASYEPGLCRRLMVFLATLPRTKSRRPPPTRAERFRKEAVC